MSGDLIPGRDYLAEIESLREELENARKVVTAIVRTVGGEVRVYDRRFRDSGGYDLESFRDEERRCLVIRVVSKEASNGEGYE